MLPVHVLPFKIETALSVVKVIGTADKVAKYFYHTFPRDFFKLSIVTFALTKVSFNIEELPINSFLKVTTCFFVLITAPRVLQQVYFEEDRAKWVAASSRS